MSEQQQAIRPIVSGGSGGRIYGLVDPNELQRRQYQQRIQQQQEMARLYSIPTRTGGSTSNLQPQERQPVSLLSLMYPVSSGTEHRRIFENNGPSNPYSYHQQSQYQPQPQPYAPNVNLPIQELVNRRQDLLRQTTENPNNYLAQLALEDCETQISQWAAVNQQQTVFPGSTDTSGNRNRGINERPEGMSRKQFNKMQPWVKKDSLRCGLTISGGVGKHLLKRMGWREGFGIGRVASGPVDPVVPDHVRATDRRGLASEGETSGAASSSTSGITATGKHPVSVLMELCAKNKFAPPEFIEIMADGPSHRPHFIMKARVNDVDYQPTNASSTKKDAKAMAAIVCLQALGVLSSTPASTNHAVEITTVESTKPVEETKEKPATSTANSSGQSS